MTNESGVSLVESLLILVVLAAIVGLLANLPNAMNLINKSKHLSLAREIVSKQIEDKRQVSYSNLTNGSSAVVDFRLSLLPSGSGTLEINDCDPVICTNGEHIKQVTITILWKESGKAQKIDLKTFIGEGGLNQ